MWSCCGIVLWDRVVGSHVITSPPRWTLLVSSSHSAPLRLCLCLCLSFSSPSPSPSPCCLIYFCAFCCCCCCCCCCCSQLRFVNSCRRDRLPPQDRLVLLSSGLALLRFVLLVKKWTLSPPVDAATCLQLNSVKLPTAQVRFWCTFTWHSNSFYL